jgi:hypothetical protein
MDANLLGLIFVLSCGPALADDATKPRLVAGALGDRRKRETGRQLGI